MTGAKCKALRATQALRLPLAAAGGTDSGTGVGTIEREEVQRSSLADVGGILLPRT